MKIRVTFEVADDERVAISVLQGNGIRPAPREDIEQFLTGTVEERLDGIRQAWREHTDALLEKLQV